MRELNDTELDQVSGGAHGPGITLFPGEGNITSGHGVPAVTNNQANPPGHTFSNPPGLGVLTANRIP